MIKNVLVINLMYIGDLLFTTPLLRVLRNNLPHAHITMLVDKKNSEVVMHNSSISELIAIDKKGYHNKLVNYLRLIGDIRQRQFDIVINLHGNERASAIAAFSGGKKIIGFAPKVFGLLFDRHLEERKDIHQADAYLDVLKQLGMPTGDHNGLELWVDQGSQSIADGLWHEATLGVHGEVGRKVIGFNTGGSWPTKRWTKSGFAKVGDALLAKGFGVAFFGGPMDVQDVNDILALMEYRNHPGIAVFTGRTTLMQMAALVKKCDALVSGDSGPMHIGVSQRVPIIAIFGPSDPVRYAPYGQPDAVVTSDLACLRCGKHQCDGHECMQSVTGDMIMKRILITVGDEKS